MNNLEKKMVTALIDLRENHHVVGVKAEFEAEGTRLEEALRLKEVVTRARLDLSIKIGGCEAIRDMFDAKIIGVNTIIAPMIESSYAMRKYTEAMKFVFSEEERNDMNFLINVETVTGFNNMADMLKSPHFADLAGVVLGRVDLAGSLDMTRDDVNCDKIFNIANTMAEKMKQLNKDFVVGGEVSANSISFFNRLPENSLTRFETRKVIFDAKSALKDSEADKGILKAIDFELMWLENKREFYKRICEEDTQRFSLLKARYNKLTAK